MRAQIDLDMIVMTGRTVAGVPVPPDLQSLPITRLRWDDNAIIDIASKSSFFIDARGVKHVTQRDPSWQPLDCAWDAVLIEDDGTWRVAGAADLLAPKIKAECSRRIRAVIKDDATQRNLTAYGADLVAKVSVDGATLDATEAAHLAIVRSIRQWVGVMLAKSRELVAAADDTFEDNAHWPDPPAGAADLAEAV